MAIERLKEVAKNQHPMKLLQAHQLGRISFMECEGCGWLSHALAVADLEFCPYCVSYELKKMLGEEAHP